MLALIGFALMIVLMFVLIKEKMAPPLAFILLPIIAAVLAGFGVADISEFIKTGMKTMMNTAILFIFSISYFTLMSDAGLFDPIINFLIKRTGKSITTVLIAVLLTTFVAHLDGSGATTFLIVVPAFLPICKKMGIRPQALLAAMCGGYGVMNLVPWGGPTMRAASVANIEVGDLYSFMIPGVVCLALFAFVIVFIVSSYALLPIIIGVVEPFGVTPETVAAAFLLTATLGTPVSPSVAAVYVGLGLADVSIGEHIKYSLRLVWPVSIAVLVMATVIGVIKF